MAFISIAHQYPLTTIEIIDVQDLEKQYLSPFYDKNASTTTQKYPLCFFEDPTYDRWMEVFDAWEQGNLIMEDRKKSDGCIPKIPQRDITLNDVDQTIGLCDCKMMKLANAILTKEVRIKSNKLSSACKAEKLYQIKFQFHFNKIRSTWPYFVNDCYI